MSDGRSQRETAGRRTMNGLAAEVAEGVGDHANREAGLLLALCLASADVERRDNLEGCRRDGEGISFMGAA